MGKLSEKVKLFCREYVSNGFNGTKAAKDVGYKDSHCKVTASRLLKKQDVLDYLEELQEKKKNRLDIKSDDLTREFANIGLFDIRKLYKEDGSLKDIHDLDEATAKAISQITVDEIYTGRGANRKKIGETKMIKVHPKIPALENIGKHIGYYNGDESNKPVVNLNNNYNLKDLPEDVLRSLIKAAK